MSGYDLVIIQNVLRRCLKIATDGADVMWAGEAIQEHERAADLSETLRH